MSETLSSTADPRDVDATMQAVRLQLFRENIGGALDLVEVAHAAHPDPRYAEQAAKIRGWLSHLGSREAYLAAQEEQYRRLRWRAGIKLLEKRIRILTRPQDAQDGRAAGAQSRVRRAGAPDRRRDAAPRARRRLRRGRRGHGDRRAPSDRACRRRRGLTRQGLAEEVHLAFPPASFDLVYSFAVLEPVRDVDATLGSIMTVLRRGGRFCFVVPMHEFRVIGPLPEYTPIHGYADHCRVFTEAELLARFGKEPDFRLVKIPGRYKPGEFPAALEPVEFGSFFVVFGKR